MKPCVHANHALHRTDGLAPIAGELASRWAAKSDCGDFTLRIFLSFASPDRTVAEQIQLALLGAGYEVFFDEASLAPGSDYNSRIRESIKECHLYIFLVSPNSVGGGRYAHTELKLVKVKWPKPWGFVLPVIIRPTEYSLIDPYLASVTVLEPSGNVAAEVAAAVEGIPQPSGGAAVSDAERRIVDSLLTFLEDRRLITEEASYQSHFPDPLRASAQEIRRRTNDALQELGRESVLAPILRRIQKGARDFQEATEGAVNGSRMSGGMTPYVPMGLGSYLRSLEVYRQEIAEGMMQAAELCGLELDPTILHTFRQGQEALRSIANSFDSRAGSQVPEASKKLTKKKRRSE
jgi:hypothetical protein